MRAEVRTCGRRWFSFRQRAVIYEDCGRNAERLLRGRIENKRDPVTHLYSKGRMWDYHNEAADHYSSLVLAAFCVRPELIQEHRTLHDTLINCRRLCSTACGVPTTYNLKENSRGKKASLGAISERLRDGLIRIAELTGTNSDWYRGMERSATP